MVPTRTSPSRIQQGVEYPWWGSTIRSCLPRAPTAPGRSFGVVDRPGIDRHMKAVLDEGGQLAVLPETRLLRREAERRDGARRHERRQTRGDVLILLFPA